MPVGRDWDQLVPGSAPEFQYAPALPIGLGPVEVDCRHAAREHHVVEPRVRVERFTHIAPSPFWLIRSWPGGLMIQACAPTACRAIYGPGSSQWPTNLQNG